MNGQKNGTNLCNKKLLGSFHTYSLTSNQIGGEKTEPVLNVSNTKKPVDSN